MVHHYISCWGRGGLQLALFLLLRIACGRLKHLNFKHNLLDGLSPITISLFPLGPAHIQKRGRGVISISRA